MFDLEDLKAHSPGLVGSLAALIFLRAPWPRMLLFVLAGGAASHYLTPAAAAWVGGEEGSMGFLIGLFSMAIAAKVFEVIESIEPRKLIERLMRRVGL